MPEDTITEEPRDVPVILGRIAERTRLGRSLPRRGRVKRYVLTSAQNNTYVHEEVWLNVLALASHYGAEIMVGTFSYQKATFGSKAVKRGTKDHRDTEPLWYDPQVIEHIVDDPVQLAPGLVWCGEMNILPTSPDPLSELEAYNGSNSNVVPHAKFAMTSVAAMRNMRGPKINYTTGTVTQRNYLQKKAGLKAERDHGYGAVLVEVDSSGSWWVRQLQAAADWSIRDLTLKAKGGVVTDGNPVEAVTWGDVHEWLLDPTVKRVAWGRNGMLDRLRPRYQFMHDLIDLRSRNHHEQKDPLLLHRKWRDGRESVAREVGDSGRFLRDVSWRPWCETVVVPSNHDEALTRWLKEAEWRRDPVNALFYHRAWVKLLEEGDDFAIFEWACRDAAGPLDGVRFLGVHDGMVLCRDAVEGGVECGMHGHLGADGARGSLKGFAKMGRPCTVGHGHSAGIYRQAWMGGVCQLDMGYARGPSSWTVSHVVLYPEGTRCMVTLWSGKPWADFRQ